MVDRQCAVTKLLINYHCKVRELLSQKLSSWQQSCSQPTKLPERALNLLRFTAPQSSGAAGIGDLLRHAKMGAAQPEQRLSVQEVPPLSNGDSNRSQPQQRPLPSSSQSNAPPVQSSPVTFRSLAARGGAAGGVGESGSPLHTSTPLSTSVSPSIDFANTSPGTSTPTTSGSSAQQSPLLMATSTSNLSPSLIPSMVLSLNQVSPASHSSLQGLTLPISQSAPHSPPLPHSAPLSRAMTPVPLFHQQGGLGSVNTSSQPHNPSLMKVAEMYATATLPLPRRPVSEMRMSGFTGTTLPRMLPLSGPSRVEAIFTHAPGGSESTTGDGACLLHFLPGDSISLLISEARDGWHYGQNERTGRKGWFPYSYTQPPPNIQDNFNSSSLLLSKANSTSIGQLDKLVSPCLPALTPESEEESCLPPQRVSTFRPRPYSMADSSQVTNQISLRPLGKGQEWRGPANRPTLSMLMQELSSDFTSPPPSPTRANPFAHIQLRKTVTNDRSAPIIE